MTRFELFTEKDFGCNKFEINWISNRLYKWTLQGRIRANKDKEDRWHGKTKKRAYKESYPPRLGHRRVQGDSPKIQCSRWSYNTLEELMSCQLKFSESDICALPIKTGDKVLYKGEETVIRSIYIRPYNESVNDIIVTFENGEYTFHDDHELERKRENE